MNLDLITEQRLKEIDARIEELKQVMAQRQVEYDPENILLDNSDFIRWLKISRRTAQTWRDANYIAFIQIDSKVFYTLADVKDFLKKHWKRAREPEEGGDLKI